MNSSRREVLKGTGGMAIMGLAIAAGLLKPGTARSEGWNKAAFDTKTLGDAVKASAAARPRRARTSPSRRRTSRKRRGVPFTIFSNLPKTESIAVLVERTRTSSRRISPFPTAPSRG